MADSFIDKVPKPVLYIGTGLLFLGVVAGFGYMMFGGKDAPQEEVTDDNTLAEFPNGETIKTESDRLKQLGIVTEGDANDYWNSLDNQEENQIADGDFVVGNGAGNKNDGSSVYLDPAVYSELEIEQIRLGIKTKAEIDLEHQQLLALQQQGVYNARSYEQQQRYRDSVTEARMNKAFEMMGKYASNGDASGEGGAKKKPVVQPEVPAEPEPRHIDLGKSESGISAVRLVEDGIICSLDDEVEESDGTTIREVQPVKATFLETEVVVSGQRVIMRLLQDLYLSNGTVIPANTHITGICKVGGRLGININTISYDGRIYYAQLDAYDNDGTEGIYCPVIAADKAKKAGKNTARRVGQSLTDLASSAVSAINPYLGVMSRTGMNEMMSIATDEGIVAVNVAAGYEFYLYEDIEANNRDVKKKSDSGDEEG